MKKISSILLAVCCFCTLPFGTSCTGKVENEDSTLTEEKKVQNKFPEMSGDLAYTYIEKQLQFGPRVPGTATHKACAGWLRSELQKFCDTVLIQEAMVKTFDGKSVPIINIIGQFKPDTSQRILLASHWDSRPWADEDLKDHDKPIPAANDGASGVGILLELASKLKNTPPGIGVDIVFFDAEDMGKPEAMNSYCLGSEYWAKNPLPNGYKANCGVLLDMVGGKDAQFFYEGYSYQNAFKILSHTWGIAAELGFAARFVPEAIGNITDDHQQVTLHTQIPMMDIIQYDKQTKNFAYFWHTHNDNMEAIDKNTLKMVGTVISALVFNPPF
ncbi:MAG: M28 family peptidase [Bacteroidetes bacterium]|nr:M28 family peptidase [Bacteroidota bacterium]